jgi:riboflavin kinase / FMN adenylyltransferase
VRILHDLRDRLVEGERAVAAIGVFDGVHLGHQHLLSRVRALAAERGAVPTVVTFDVHPALVLRPENAPLLLTTLEQRLELLEQHGVEVVYLVHFDEQRAQTSPEDFAQQVFVDALATSAVVVGEDFHFGRGRSGDVNTLGNLGARFGFDVLGLDLVTLGPDAPEPVRSTAVRRALAGGDVAAAAAMLGRLFEIRGTVIHGEQRGRTIGFPTANIAADLAMAWPADAVYAGWFVRANGDRHACAVNIGRRPTFHEHADRSLLEAHLLDFEGDLYGEEVAVQFVEFLRSEQRFSGIDALVAQLKDDVERSRQVLGT